MSYASNVHRWESDDLFKMNSSSSFLIICGWGFWVLDWARDEFWGRVVTDSTSIPHAKHLSGWKIEFNHFASLSV